jgi:hypothetical protein
MHKVGLPNWSEKVKLIWYYVKATLKPQMYPRHFVIVIRGNYWFLTILKIVLVETILLDGDHVNRFCAMLTMGRVLTFSITSKNVWSLNPKIMGVFLGVQVLRCRCWVVGWVVSTFERNVLHSCTRVKRPSGYFPWDLSSLEDLSTMLLWKFGSHSPKDTSSCARRPAHTPLWESPQAASFLDWREGEILLLYIWRRKRNLKKFKTSSLFIFSLWVWRHSAYMCT